MPLLITCIWKSKIQFSFINYHKRLLATPNLSIIHQTISSIHRINLHIIYERYFDVKKSTEWISFQTLSKMKKNRPVLKNPWCYFNARHCLGHNLRCKIYLKILKAMNVIKTSYKHSMKYSSNTFSYDNDTAARNYFRQIRN